MTTEKAPTPLVDACAGRADEGLRYMGGDGAWRLSYEIIDAGTARQLERESIRLAERLKEAREALKHAAIAIESAARHGVDQDHPMYASLMRDAKKARDALLRSGEGE